MSPNEEMESNNLKQDITRYSTFTYNPKSDRTKSIRIDGYPVNINIQKYTPTNNVKL